MKVNKKQWLAVLLLTSTKVFSFLAETENRLREFDIELDSEDRENVEATDLTIQALNDECQNSHGGEITPGTDFAFRNLAMLLDCVEVHHAIYAKHFDTCECSDCAGYELEYTLCRAMIRTLASATITE